jgi:hypothetical protein
MNQALYAHMNNKRKKIKKEKKWQVPSTICRHHLTLAASARTGQSWLYPQSVYARADVLGPGDRYE